MAEHTRKDLDMVSHRLSLGHIVPSFCLSLAIPLLGCGQPAPAPPPVAVTPAPGGMPASPTTAATAAADPAAVPAGMPTPAAAENPAVPAQPADPAGNASAPADPAANPATVATTSSGALIPQRPGTAAAPALPEQGIAATPAAAPANPAASALPGAAMADAANPATPAGAANAAPAAIPGNPMPAAIPGAPAAGTPALPGDPAAMAAGGAAAAGVPGAAGTGEAIQAQKGTIEYAILRLAEMAKSGDYTGAEELFSKRIKGEGLKIKEGELTEEKIAAYKVAFDGVDFVGRKSVAGGVQFNFRNKQNQLIQFVVGKENEEYVIREFVLREPSKKNRPSP